jgi:ABC-type nitrate/sulfonate/bicarbonate transport system substrate-binding protein
LLGAGRGAATFVTLSVAGATLGLPAFAQSARLVLGTIPINALLGAYLGALDVLKEQGLDTEISSFQSGPAMLQALAAGKLAAADIGLAPTVIALTRGLPVIAPHLASFSTPERPFERIMVPADSPIHTLDDLKGRKLAYLGPGTVPDLILGALERRAGLRKEDISLIPMPAASQPAALAHGLVDAIFAIPPADAVAERQRARTLANASDLVPYLGLANVVVRQDFADSFPDATRRFFKACIRLARWIDDNDVAAREQAGRSTGLTTDLSSAVRLPPFARNGLAVLPNVWHVYEMLVAAKTIEPHPDPAKLFQDRIIEPAHRFVLPAVEEVGFDPDPAIEQMLRATYPMLKQPVEHYYAEWERRLLGL